MRGLKRILIAEGVLPPGWREQEAQAIRDVNAELSELERGLKRSPTLARFKLDVHKAAPLEDPFMWTGSDASITARGSGGRMTRKEFPDFAVAALSEAGLKFKIRRVSGANVKGTVELRGKPWDFTASGGKVVMFYFMAPGWEHYGVELLEE